MTAVVRRAKTQADQLKQAGIVASRVNLTLMEPEALTLIRDPQHPLYDPRVEWAVDPADPFYRDIELNGVRDPVKVRKNGEKNGVPILQVVDGRQRVQTLIHLNKTKPASDGKRRKLKVEFVAGDDSDMVLLSLATNHQRRDETPFSRAVKIQKAKSLGRSNEEIAQACRWTSTRQVEDHLLILNVIPEVQQAFNGELPAGAISTFAKVPREEQKSALAKVREGGAKTRAEVKAAVTAAVNGTAYVAPVAMKYKVKPEVAKRLIAAIQSAPNAPETGAAGAVIATLRYLLGEPEALNGHPEIQAAVLLAENAS